ncbi:hypothetical protein D1AOALGA4SA_11407 [Olavius algarvensis Delta 1 endosymbiont]|nr:hypothetical protein D1AOALGA4SA_11407 [Olavius algarvensis Delta 1 endosymbiont]
MQNLLSRQVFGRSTLLDFLNDRIQYSMLDVQCSMLDVQQFII